MHYNFSMNVYTVIITPYHLCSKHFEPKAPVFCISCYAMLRPWAPSCGSTFAPVAQSWRTSASIRCRKMDVQWMIASLLVQLHPNYIQIRGRNYVSKRMNYGTCMYIYCIYCHWWCHIHYSRGNDTLIQARTHFIKLIHKVFACQHVSPTAITGSWVQTEVQTSQHTAGWNLKSNTPYLCRRNTRAGQTKSKANSQQLEHSFKDIHGHSRTIYSINQFQCQPVGISSMM